MIATLQDDVFRPPVIERAVTLALEELGPWRNAERLARIDAELAALDAEHAELIESVRRGGDVDLLARLVGRLQALQARRQTLTTARPTGGAIMRPTVPDALERRLRAKLADWRGLLTRNVESGRDVLKALLVEPLRFEPVIDGHRRAYRFRGTIALDRLVAGVIELKALTSGTFPAGFARRGIAAIFGIFRPERGLTCYGRVGPRG